MIWQTVPFKENVLSMEFSIKPTKKNYLDSMKQILYDMDHLTDPKWLFQRAMKFQFPIDNDPSLGETSL